MVTFFGRWNGPVTPAAASKIIGEPNVLIEELEKVWNGKLQKRSVPYSKKVLKDAAAENKAGKSDWYLAYRHGYGLSQLENWKVFRSALAVNSNYFCEEILEDAPDLPHDMPLLIDMRLRFCGKTKSEQMDLLASETELTIAPASFVAAVAHAIYRLRKKEVLTGWHHGGMLTLPTHVDDVPAQLCPIRVGMVEQGICHYLLLDGCSEIPRKDLGVCVVRKPMKL